MTQIRYCEVSNILFAEQAQSRDILIAKNFKITVLYYRQRNIMFFIIRVTMMHWMITEESRWMNIKKSTEK